MISNRIYYCLTLLVTVLTLSSCLDSDNDNINYELSSDAQVTSLRLSSKEDSLNILSRVGFSINQVAYNPDQVGSNPLAPIIFNKDSLPYLFDVEMARLSMTTNRASGVKLHLANPDSTYIWNMSDSVKIKRLKQIEVFAEDGRTTKKYTFVLNTHQQDPDTIFWQNIKTDNYIGTTPTDQVTVSNGSKFYTYFNANNNIGLYTSSIDNGVTWLSETLNGLPQNVVLKSIQTNVVENIERWFALDTNDKVYLSSNGLDWTSVVTDYPVKTIYGKMPSYSKDSVLAVVKDGDVYKFAKTIDFSSIRVMNEIPSGFPVSDFTHTTVQDPIVYTAKFLITTGGKDIDGAENNDVWLMEEDGNEITYRSPSGLSFNVQGASLFRYDNKIYLLTSEGGKNVFYTSINYGVFWEKASNKQSLPSEFLLRENQSVNIDQENNIWIFGGVLSNQNQIVEVWKGRINKLFVK